ncbi:HAD family hydrolase [Rubrivirga marina]|uniref:phosphoglycolate phosphatase n=1 Tax=Rubrivirga marina TaxID=1196024 RepID=A0A271J3Q8_9BACT|nr:HAD family hydrolase [Rubrivirga marina]PAP78156.1 hypothetical protein BSZ37_17810 [Rubrivirga marina]
MPVLLFDIDGTLLQSNGVGRQSVNAALAALAGETFDFSDITFSGKTDRQIFREVLEAGRRCGLDVSADQADRFGELYQREMEQNLPAATVEALPGAVDLVRQLADDDAEVGMLTGNLEPLAYAKVERIGLGEAELPFGAFGSDHHDRNALPAVAAQRASERYGREVPTSELVIIGDTPRDIACARAAGALVVAVATGRFDARQLREADVVLDSLEAFSLDALPAAA